jgi:nucleoside-diphosphate-sugar epimerase
MSRRTTEAPRLAESLHRLRVLLARMAAAPTERVIDEKLARWRAPRGYVDNVAAAIGVAASKPSAAGRVYNVAEPDCCTDLEGTEQIAKSFGWRGRFVTAPFEAAPANARVAGNLDQHWVVDSTRIREELGYQEPILRMEALRRTVLSECGGAPTFPGLLDLQRHRRVRTRGPTRWQRAGNRCDQ